MKTTESSLSVYKELVDTRNTPSIMYGTSEFAVISNDTVFAFTRCVPHDKLCTAAHKECAAVCLLVPLGHLHDT